MDSPVTPTSSAAAEGQRKRDIAEAESALRGGALNPEKTYALAERLKNANEFGYARKLFGQILAKGDYRGLSKSPIKVGQRHALCTYKDPDLQAADRFKRALEILDEVDRLKLTEQDRSKTGEIAARQETLGLRGSIYKRRWQVEGNRMDLERSLACYYEGYELGPEHDQGYTGINAAYVLDLLARENASGMGKMSGDLAVVHEQWSRAYDIRQTLAKLLPTLPTFKGNDWLLKEWWFYSTRAEAHFGLGEYDQALAVLREYNDAVGLEHDEPPLQRVSAWEFESTITQLASLAQLQADLAELFESNNEWKGRWPYPAAELRERARRTLGEYLGRMAPGVERAFDGKLGLALSGGGFRASLFHLGVLACLAERDVLRRVEVLSCVSGGSIIGAHFYLELKHLLETRTDNEITQQDYVELVRRLEHDFLRGIETNIRCQVFSSIWTNLRTFFQPGYTPTRRLGELYEARLYSRVPDERGGKPRYLRDLFVQPKDEVSDFKPKYDNWRRAARVPTLVLNATTMNTGHNWQFTASWMGEPPSSLDAEIEGNYRLRRMYHFEAPRLKDKWRNRLLRPFAPPDYQRFRLGDAVAASSSVPGLFEPLVLPDLYEDKTVRLADGGVYDNQGISSLLEQDCNVMIVSDASGQMAAQDHPSGGRLGVPLRSFSVSMARIRQSQYQELEARLRSGLLKGLMFLHLKKDLDADPVDWRECQDPHDASDEARPAGRRGVLTFYGLQKRVQELLSAIRTDLDSFTEIEAFSLMTSGYRMAEASIDQLPGLPSATGGTEYGWRFLKIEPLLNPGPGFDEIMKHLRVAGSSVGKVWVLCTPLMISAVAIGLAVAYAIARLWVYAENQTLLTVRGLGIWAATVAATVLVPWAVRILRYRQTVWHLELRFLFAAILAIPFKLHLLFFDPLFLRLGRISRFMKMREG